MMKKQLAGHTFLASLGKKRLRPGGIAATNWLQEKGTFSSETKVLEVACNMGTTAIELAHNYHCKIIGVDLDEQALKIAQKNINNANLADYIQVQKANALHLPFPDNTFDIIINEAMLTMLTQSYKEKALKEYCRVLKPSGKLLTHDIAFASTQQNATQVLSNLQSTINMTVAPLPTEDWKQLFKDAGFHNIQIKTGKMSLMSPQGMIKDEGFVNTIRIIKNGLKKENRFRFLQMRKFFHQAKNDLSYIAICSEK